MYIKVVMFLAIDVIAVDFRISKMMTIVIEKTKDLKIILNCFFKLEHKKFEVSYWIF